ncbi:MAG TPA: hypothetical protein VG187_19085 [Mycobacterium sp.]|nr:hypothetical protein [Mycobacterium sp.]
MDEDLKPRAFVAQVLARHLRLPAGWDDAERQEFIDDAPSRLRRAWLNWPTIGPNRR